MLTRDPREERAYWLTGQSASTPSAAPSITHPRTRRVCAPRRLKCNPVSPVSRPRARTRGPLVADPPRDREHQPLQRHRGGQLGQVHVPLIRLRRLLIVDGAPGRREHLLGDEPGDQAAADAERQEGNLTHDLSPVFRACTHVGTSRTGRYGSASGGCPASICRPRSSSALNSAPSRTAMLVSHSHTRNTTTDPSAPYVLL